ncbi:MAG TPA: GreA/GreB family elongation factor [Luteimonas sp.]|nr:GreA/GreB family elongation factor [Luteimonas sp.]
MSRAFVKETDGDFPDDLPELPISEHPNHVTAQGVVQLRERLSAAQSRLAAVASDALGARLERAMIERELRWLQARIASALVVAPVAAHDRVGFGATVDVIDDHGHTHRYRIVGEDEADPERGLVSWVSPLARALNGARVGDSVMWKRPIGDLAVEIVAIE